MTTPMVKKTAQRPVPAKPAKPVFPTEDSIGFVMRITLRNLRTAVKGRLAQEGIPWSVWFYLRVLWEEDGLSQRELSDRVGMMQPTTVTALKVMERLDLVTLDRVDEDKRRMSVRLTRKGRALQDRLLPDLEALNNDVALKDFSAKEKATLRNLLLRMRRNMEDHVNGSTVATVRGNRAGTDDE
jgi:DNA-binding MarR family transcriptional regulator